MLGAWRDSWRRWARQCRAAGVGAFDGPGARGLDTSRRARLQAGRLVGARPERGGSSTPFHSGAGAVHWMRGHLMPTGAAGRGDSRCRGEGTPIADSQDA